MTPPLPEPDDEFILIPGKGYVEYAYLERIAIVVEAGGTLQQAVSIASDEARLRCHLVMTLGSHGPLKVSDCLCWRCFAKKRALAAQRPTG